MYNVLSHLVYATKASDVDTVIITGKPVMEGRKVLTIDEPAVLAKAREYGEKVRKSLAQSKSADAQSSAGK